jgi:hypothetical protein
MAFQAAEESMQMIETLRLLVGRIKARDVAGGSADAGG